VKLVIYAGGEYLTGDEIAAALVQYSEALGSSGTAESVSVPIREADGSEGSALFLLGPASQIVVKSVMSGQEELIDHETVELLHERTRRLKPTPPSTALSDHWF
jgi:hypothetical protein